MILQNTLINAPSFNLIVPELDTKKNCDELMLSKTNSTICTEVITACTANSKPKICTDADEIVLVGISEFSSSS